ncbi:MAG: hypothetical protein QXF56_05585 [Candidatus Micrarchaeia archaeon]
MKLKQNEKIILKNSSLLNGMYFETYFHGIPINKKCNPANIYLTNQRIYVETRALNICAVDLPLSKIHNVEIQRAVKYGLPIDFFNPKGLAITYREGTEFRKLFLNLWGDNLDSWLRKINEARGARS